MKFNWIVRTQKYPDSEEKLWVFHHYDLFSLFLSHAIESDSFEFVEVIFKREDDEKFVKRRGRPKKARG